MSATGMLIQGAFVAPPRTDNNEELAITSSASAVQDLGATIRKDCMVSFVSTVSWNIVFDSDNAVDDPSANGYFAANTVYSFGPGSKDRYFKVRGSGNGNIMWWRSTRA